MHHQVKLITVATSLAVLLVLGQQAPAQKFKVGDSVVVIAQCKLHIQRKPSEPLGPGLVLKITEVDGKRLWTHRGKAGWVDRDNVLPLGRGAIDRLTAMLKAKPDNAGLCNARGLAWNALGEWDRAIADFSEAIHISPKHAPAYANRASAWMAKEEYDKALDDYTSTLRLKPNSFAVYNNRALLWRKKGDKATEALSRGQAI